MGKSVKKKKNLSKAAAAAHPYARGDGMDVDMDVDTGPNEGSAAKQETTRGHILQRHKIEHKMLRKEIEKLQQSGKKLNKKNMAEKKEKKDLSKKVKEMQEGLKKKQEQELIDFDRAEQEKASSAMEDDMGDGEKKMSGSAKKRRGLTLFSYSAAVTNRKTKASKNLMMADPELRSKPVAPGAI